MVMWGWEMGGISPTIIVKYVLPHSHKCMDDRSYIYSPCSPCMDYRDRKNNYTKFSFGADPIQNGRLAAILNLLCMILLMKSSVDALLVYALKY